MPPTGRSDDVGGRHDADSRMSGRGGPDPDASPGRGLLGRISLGLAVERVRQSLFFLPALFILAAGP